MESGGGGGEKAPRDMATFYLLRLCCWKYITLNLTEINHVIPTILLMQNFCRHVADRNFFLLALKSCIST